MKVLYPIDLKNTRLDSNRVVVATTSLTSLYSVPVADFRSMRITLQTVMGTDYAVREFLAIHNGTSGYLTEYAVVSTNDASAFMTDDFSADVVAGNFHLYVIASSATSRTFTLSVQIIGA